jgi:flagellar biosynthesis/type III secretory pathway protein FliH
MDINKITEKIEKYAEERYDEGWSEGYDAGRDVGESDGESIGWSKHRDMMSFRMSLSYDTAMSNNKFREAKLYKEIIEYLELNFIDDPLNNLDK